MDSSDKKYSSFEIIPNSKIILCYFQGPTLMEDIININQQFISHPSYSPEFDIIMDFRNSNMLVFRIDILEYLGYFKKTVKLKTKVKSAILLNSMNGEFLFKTYKAFISLFNIETEKFYQLEDCLKWINAELNQSKEFHEALSNLTRKIQEK
ncbi:MAG: hypothetical protein KA981_10965 [Bacteroidia bacterium]|jgi:hypothetical protein|nr:hypothetical protein [Bacteroidia bacterium]